MVQRLCWLFIPQRKFKGKEQTVTKIMRWVDNKIADTISWLDEHWHLGSLLRFVCAAVTIGVPVLQSFSNAKRPSWLVPFVALFASPLWLLLFFPAAGMLFLLNHYREGGARRRLLDSINEIAGPFAGGLDDFGRALTIVPNRLLSESECKTLCIGLLRGITEAARFALEAEDGPKIRATLAVPYASRSGGRIDALRVWCYDDTHKERHYTVIPLEIEGKLAPGAPAAYVEDAFQVIHDIRKVPGPAAQSPRPYVSVVSIPVPAKGSDGRPLAVISIDADEPNFFSRPSVYAELDPLVAPIASAIGLVLSSRNDRRESHEF